MNKPSAVILALFIAAGCFVAGRWSAPQQPAGSPAASAKGRRILYYHDPMHPAYKSDKPGIAPDCGMELEPVYEDGGPAAAKRPGTVEISSAKQQLIGVKVAAVERSQPKEMLRLPARVAVDETRAFRIITATEGQIKELLPNSVGVVVKKDELLATFYSPQFLNAQQTYLYGISTLDRFKQDKNAHPDQEKVARGQLQAAEENLLGLGMTPYQLRQIAEKRQPSRNIDVRAPSTSLILARNVANGQRFDRNTELYRLADLNHVWIFADVYEREARFVRPGQNAKVLYQGRTIPVKTSDVLSQFDPATRTMKVRFEAENPDYVLRPDMFVDVEFPVGLPAAVTVPVDAVVDSGLRKIVYVDRGEGMFEPRPVETSWQLDDRIGISSGLEPGERIVVAGTFLIDSETRMQQAAAPVKSAAASVKPTDPVCGMEVDPARAHKLAYEGKTFHFCSPDCKKEFEKNPAKYTGKKAGA